MRKSNKRIIQLALITIIIMTITGCQSKGLLTYQEALETTNNIDKGEIKIEVDTHFNFDKTGLTFEEEKALSDFEEMSGILTSKYDIEQELMETNIYYIQGGMGIDFSLFLKDQQLILQLPIINLFMILNEEDMINVSMEEEAISSEGLVIDFDQVMADWISVFREDDVVVGNNTYIMTNEGQLKTTKYSFNLDSQQLKMLEEQLFAQIDIDELNKLVNQQVNNYNDYESEVIINIEELLEKIVLNSIEGEAYVDFDNRLIRQNFVLKGEGIDVQPGDLDTFEINLSMTYTNLGEEQLFEFPTLTDENIVDQEKLEEIFEMFGE